MRQARKWEEAAAAQMLLSDLRDGNLPAAEAPNTAGGESLAPVQPGSGSGASGSVSPGGGRSTSLRAFAAAMGDELSAKFGAGSDK